MTQLLRITNIFSRVMVNPLGCRLMVGQRFLVPYVRVRLLPPQPNNVVPSSSGLGRRPLKAEIAGSNPVGTTREFQRSDIMSDLFSCLLLLKFS